MELRYKYSESELKQLLKDIVVLVDSREQQNSHILDYFSEKGIKYKVEKLNFADYSFMLPANQELGLQRDLHFSNLISIERKGSLEELSGNFTKDRDRIENEFTRAKGKVTLLIENASFEDIINHNYNTQYNNKSFLATLQAFQVRYNLNINFIKSNYTGMFIYSQFYYFLREYLKN